MMAAKSRSRPGATIVEFAFVAIIYVFLMFGIMEFCLLVFTYNIVENAAREGARYGVVNVVDTTMIADTKNVTKNFMVGLDQKMKNYDCQVYLANSSGTSIGNATDAKFGEYICVEVSLDYTPITPGLGFLKTIKLRSKCSMASEAN